MEDDLGSIVRVEVEPNDQNCKFAQIATLSSFECVHIKQQVLNRPL